MLTYRTNLAARGTPQPYAPPSDDELLLRAPKQRNRVGRPPQLRERREWDYAAPILLEVERWLKEHHLSASRFGKMAVNDPNLVFQLRAGRDPSSKVVAKLRAYMAREGSHGE